MWQLQSRGRRRVVTGGGRSARSQKADRERSTAAGQAAKRAEAGEFVQLGQMDSMLAPVSLVTFRLE